MKCYLRDKSTDKKKVRKTADVELNKNIQLCSYKKISIIIFVLIVFLVTDVNLVKAEETTSFDIVSIDDIIINQDETNNKTFNDINGHWAKDNILNMVQKGVISGYPDGTFRPDRTITRAEFVTLLVKAFNMQVQTGKEFTDTQNHWAKDNIATAYSKGIVKGISESQFEPDAEITREQMTIMIAYAANLGSSQYSLKYEDQNQISAWAVWGVSTSTEKNIVSGYPDNTFRPQNTATRAEALTAIIKAQ